MKKNIILIIVLVLIVGVVAGYALKGSLNNDQGAAVSLSTKTDIAAMDKMFESTSSNFLKVGVNSMYRFDPTKITASVDLNKLTKDTERFTMRFPETTTDGTTISPMLEPINCGLAPGFNSTVNCCNTESNNMTITNPNTGFTMTVTGGCINGEWDVI